MGDVVLGRRDKIAAHSVRRSRLPVSIMIGILVGGIFAFFYAQDIISLNHFYEVQGSRRTTSILQIESLSSKPSEHVNMLRSDVADLSSKMDELKQHVTDLTAKLMVAEQKNSKAPGHPLVVPDYSINPRLSKLLENIAVQNELIVAIANSNVKSMLEIWFTSIKKLGIPNYLVVALDDGIVDFCKENEVPFYKRDPDESLVSFGRTGSNLPVSRLKFKILREVLQLGYSVLLSDVDIVYIQNPFDHIHRDSDVEAMSDGYNNMTAYGYNDVSDDPSMGWSRYVDTVRIWVYNSGFFYLKPTLSAIELLDRLAERLAQPLPVWEQMVFNEELFFPSYPGYVGLHASKRTMDRYMFMNSKVLFKEVRKDSKLKKLKPVVVHVNYHPDKLPRMKAIVEFYSNGKEDALEMFPDGSDW